MRFSVRSCALLACLVLTGLAIGDNKAKAAGSCTIYVSPSGSDRSSGATSTSPTSLTHARSIASPGAVVCLGAGTYNRSSSLVLNRSGAPGKPITYTSYNGTATVRFTGTSITGGGVIQLASGSNWSGAHDIVIDGLTIDGNNAMGAGVFAGRGSHNITVRNCRIMNGGASGIAFNATDYAVAEDNLIYHSGYGKGWSSGISLWYGGKSGTYGGPTAWYNTAPGFHNVIVRNVVSGQFDASTHHTDGNGFIVDGSGNIPPALFADNVAYQNGGRGLQSLYNSGNVWFVNNTAYTDGLDTSIGQGKAAEFMGNNATNLHLVNNIAYSRKGSRYSTGYTYGNNNSTISWARDLAYPSSTFGVTQTILTDSADYRSVNPDFVSPPPIPSSSTPWASALPPWNLGNRLAPAFGSPAIDRGVNPLSLMPAALASSAAPYLQKDAAGNPRVQGAAVDLGAYEY